MRGGSSSEVTGKHIVDSTLRRQITHNPLNVTDGFINVPVANSLDLVLLSSPSRPMANPSSPHQSHSDPMHVYSHHAPYIFAYLVRTCPRNSPHLLDA